MNNAKIIETFTDPTPPSVEMTPQDNIPFLRHREGELVTIIEALRKVESSPEWSTLKTQVFDGVVESLERRLSSEATKKEVNAPELYRLQGQLAWAKRFANLASLADAFRLELSNIKGQLHGK